MKTRMKTDEQKEFHALFRQLTDSRSMWEVWSDMMQIFACAISNRVDGSHFEKRENTYLSIIKRYSHEEVSLFTEILSLVILNLAIHPFQDFLGALYMNLNIGQKNKGQFFTPYDVGKAMALMMAGDIPAVIKEKGYASVNDPCCGGGCLLIAFAEAAHLQQVDYSKDILFVAQDIDYTVALMCYIQLSLIGCAGYVVVGNSLAPYTPDAENYWFTPAFCTEHWQRRMQVDKRYLVA